MPELVEQLYCSQQIVIPAKFPYILKRYCKAAIKTQPYDLLRWSFEYFRALSLNQPPPVKLRLEYPIFNTEGGLTKGCLKVIAKQLSGMDDVPLASIRAAWRSFCLDMSELHRIFCLCEVFLRSDVVPFLHFVAVAAGMLTKNLTNTMILLCETLTTEAEGGSAFIPTRDFLIMYNFLAKMDASKDVKYINGYREDFVPIYEPPPPEPEESVVSSASESSTDDYWEDTPYTDLKKLALTEDRVPHQSRLSKKLAMPTIGEIERTRSVERATMIAKEQYLRDRKGKPMTTEEIDAKLRAMSMARLSTIEKDAKEREREKEEAEKRVHIAIKVLDEDENELPFRFYGEPPEIPKVEEEEEEEEHPEEGKIEEEENPPPDPEASEPEDLEPEEKPSAPVVVEGLTLEEEEQMRDAENQKISDWILTLYEDRENRRLDLEKTFEEIAAIVDRWKSASYDLGMIAGRQMSATSGEFIVKSIEKEIMAYIDEQIAILPDPDLKKKKAKPEEVQMIRNILEEFLDENMEEIVKEYEEVEEEEEPIPEVVVVYAVPGIGPPVDSDIICDFIRYIKEMSRLNNDVTMPRNLRHFLCPPLEKFQEEKYDEKVHHKEVFKKPPPKRIMV